jgi:hypothetical protein
MNVIAVSRITAAAGTAALLMGASAMAAAATVPDFTQHGFAQVVAQKSIQPGQAATLTAGDITVQVPAGAFATPVQFDLLEGSNAAWQAKAPAGQTVIANFAFKVVNPANGQLVGTFQKPVLFTLTNPKVGPASVYYNVTPTGAFVKNPIPAKIVGDQLSHPIAAALVGWAVTSPAAATTVATGLPLAPVMGVGAALALAGAYLVVRPRKA